MILRQLQKAIAKDSAKITGLKIKPEDVLLKHPEEEKWGDYSSNIAFILAKRRRKNPRKLAEAIVKEISNSKQNGIPAVFNVAGAGFINISIKNECFIKELQRALRHASDYGKSDLLQAKKIMVEFAQPNTHKLFHIGHLRGIILGESVCRLLESQGAEVIRANYQGDIGLHVAKCLWSLCKGRAFTSELTGKKRYVKARPLHLGKAYVKGNKAYETDKKAKKEILEINKKIYDQSDSKINKLWQKTREQSLAYFSKIYKRVGTNFDRLFFESEVSQTGKAIVLKALKKGIFIKSQGAIIFPGEKYGLHNRVFITQEDNPTYEAKDIALAKLQLSEFGELHQCLHIVASEQKEYFRVLFKALTLVFPKSTGKEFHLPFGLVRLKKGKMSSRLGNVILGEWLLDKAKKKIKNAFPELNEETAEIIAVGAVKYSFLKINPKSALTFDFNESISLQGNSGPYLQYTYARCQSVLQKASIIQRARLAGGQITTKNWQLSVDNRQFKPEEQAILRTFYKFPEAIQQAAELFSPNLLANFLYDLAQKYNSFYNKHRILDADAKNAKNKKDKKLKTQNFRLALTKVTAEIIKNGLYLLAIKSPEEM